MTLYEENNNNFFNRRLNHLIELLNQYENNKIIDIPPMVLENINQEMINRKINKCDLDMLQLRRILKKLCYRKYCEYSLQILCYFNGTVLPTIKEDHKMKIIKVFEKIVNSYSYCCPPNRLSFFNYNYVLHRICELINLNEYLILFPLPYKKGTPKMIQNDLIWKNLCEYGLNETIKEFS